MIELNHLDYAIIHKSKIDPLRLFSSTNYTIELQGYIIYLLDSGKNVPQELFSEITREDRYKRNFPQIESICVDILNTLLKNGLDIEEEKYNDVLLGVQSNDSMSENFIYRVVRDDYPFPLSFSYIYEDYPRESYYIFRGMVERDYTHEIPDFIIEAIRIEQHYIEMAIKDIIEYKDTRRFFSEYIDTFTSFLVNIYNHIIDRTKDLKNILTDSDIYEKEQKIFFGYIEDLKRILQIFSYNNVIDDVQIFLDFLKTKKFQDHINIYLKFRQKTENINPEINYLKKLLDNFIHFQVKESLSFKSFFYNR
jgi:hypothetical protein